MRRMEALPYELVREHPDCTKYRSVGQVDRRARRARGQRQEHARSEKKE